MIIGVVSSSRMTFLSSSLGRPYDASVRPYTSHVEKWTRCLSSSTQYLMQSSASVKFELIVLTGCLMYSDGLQIAARLTTTSDLAMSALSSSPACTMFICVELEAGRPLLLSAEQLLDF